MTFQGRAISRKTYLEYANKYDIPITKKDWTPKTMKQLAKAIYEHEMDTIFFQPNKYGLYVVR